MAQPTVSTPVAVEWAGAFSAMRQYLNNLWDTVPDYHYTSRAGAYENKPLPKPGEIRVADGIIGRGEYQKVWCDGECWFQWCLNRTGAAINQFDLVSRPVPLTGQTATGGTVNTITDAGLTEHALVHTLVRITQDAGMANAAPENESAYVAKNNTGTIYVQPDFTVAPANADVYAIYYPYNIESSAAGDEASEVKGAVVSPDGIANAYWGWVLYKGMVWVKVGAALAQDRAIIAHTAQVAPSSGSAVNLWIGYAPMAVSTAEASAMVELQCGPAAMNKCVSG